MSDRFSLISSAAEGQWLHCLEGEPFGSILSIVPAGYEMYARVFHPVERDRPCATGTWLGVDEASYFSAVTDIAAALQTELVSWRTVATSFGTLMHPEAQYAQLVRGAYGEVNQVIAPDGWRYNDVAEGCVQPSTLSALATILRGHTSTPDSGVAAVWNGWGSMFNAGGGRHFDGGMPAYYSDEPVPGQKSGSTLAPPDCLSAPGINHFNSPDTDDGASLRISNAALLEIHEGTGREYVLFHAGVNDFIDEQWISIAPWVQSSVWAQTPNILWPEDRSWVLATEIDFDSTLIAGSKALVEQLMRTPGLEVLPIHPSANLTTEGDRLNPRSAS